jgi:HAD superfamily hydrolase (TIGR01509 family)
VSEVPKTIVKEVHWDADGVLFDKIEPVEWRYYAAHTIPILNQESLMRAFEKLYDKSTAEYEALNREFRQVRTWEEELRFYDFKHTLLLKLVSVPATDELLAHLKHVMLSYFYHQKNLTPEIGHILETLKQNNVIQFVVSNAFPGRPEQDIQSNRWDVDFNQYFLQYIISAKVGSRKPDQEIYRIALDQSEHPSSQIAFIDDQLENVLAAKDMKYGTPVHFNRTHQGAEYYDLKNQIYIISHLAQLLNFMEFPAAY